jgi:hypothetical protein
MSLSMTLQSSDLWITLQFAEEVYRLLYQAAGLTASVHCMGELAAHLGSSAEADSPIRSHSLQFTYFTCPLLFWCSLTMLQASVLR